MTAVQDQKKRERSIVQFTACMLNEEWTLRESESPDFIVTTPNAEFGLEVTECHAGIVNKKGSDLKRSADAHQKIMNEIREYAVEKYPQVSGWALSFLGPWTDRDGVRASVMRAIECEINGIDQDDSLQIKHQIFGSIPSVMITPRPFSPPIRGWLYMEDYAGALEISSSPLQAAIDAKAGKLSDYKQKCNDIRLLVSANSLEASGNVSVLPATSPEIHGFDAVYFVYFPNYAIEYPSGRVVSCVGHTPASLADALRQSEELVLGGKKSV